MPNFRDEMKIQTILYLYVYGVIIHIYVYIFFLISCLGVLESRRSAVATQWPREVCCVTNYGKWPSLPNSGYGPNIRCIFYCNLVRILLQSAFTTQKRRKLFCSKYYDVLKLLKNFPIFWNILWPQIILKDLNLIIRIVKFQNYI